jgi:hypothetical protein
MTHTNRPLPQRTTPLNATRRRHAANFSDAVVAAYIHDISARRRPARLAEQSEAHRRR